MQELEYEGHVGISDGSGHHWWRELSNVNTGVEGGEREGVGKGGEGGERGEGGCGKGRDTVKIVVLDVYEGSLLMHQYGRDGALLLCIQQHREEVVDDIPVHISTVVTRDEGL